MKKIIDKFKSLPSWISQLILSILFFILITGGMMITEVLDAGGAQMTIFYLFLSVWIGSFAFGLFKGILAFIRWIQTKMD